MVSSCPIHQSAWNRNSANFAFWAFAEVRLASILRSLFCAIWFCANYFRLLIGFMSHIDNVKL